jgi:tetraacyldisaccharide 4'-kinase
VVLNGSGADIAAEIGLVGAHQIELQALGLRNIASHLIVPVNAWEGGVKVHAVCGIGHPERFAQTLKELGFEVILSSVNDHQHLSDDDLEFGDDLPMIITSKDAVKYRGVIPDNLWVLEVEMSISEDFVHSLAEQAGLTITAT